MEGNTAYWSASLEEMIQGYTYNAQMKTYHCLLCGQAYEEGEIFPVGDRFFTAEKMMAHHLETEHGGVFNSLIEMNKKFTGISENQKDVLRQMYAGHSDQEISEALSLSPSTVRNYRFKFREKERQAKTFLAIMASMKRAEQTGKSEPVEMVEPHRTATMLDDRYNITEKERETIIGRYLDENGKLILGFPSKEKRKVIILTELAKHFKAGRTYTEEEVNRILGRAFEDYVTLRRYLIEYGFLDRDKACKKYWVKE